MLSIQFMLIAEHFSLDKDEFLLWSIILRIRNRNKLKDNFLLRVFLQQRVNLKIMTIPVVIKRY